MKTLKNISLILLLTSCSTIKHHGPYINDDDIKKLQENSSKKTLNMDEVFEILGTPNFRSEIPDSHQFYYIYRLTSYNPFLKPKTIKQRIVQLNFSNTEDKLLKFEVIDNKFNDNIKMLHAYTLNPTEQEGVLRTYFSNFRRFVKRDNKR